MQSLWIAATTAFVGIIACALVLAYNKGDSKKVEWAGMIGFFLFEVAAVLALAIIILNR